MSPHSFYEVGDFFYVLGIVHKNEMSAKLFYHLSGDSFYGPAGSGE